MHDKNFSLGNFASQIFAISGVGALFTAIAPRLRPRSRLFSSVCLSCCLSKQKVEALIAAPDLDELIESFRNKRNLNAGRHDRDKDSTSAGTISQGLSASRRMMRNYPE